MHFRKSCLTCMVIGVLALVESGHANMVANGSFEGGFDIGESQNLGTATVASISSNPGYNLLTCTGELPDRVDYWCHADHSRTGYFVQFTTGSLVGQRAFITSDISTVSTTASSLSYEPLVCLPAIGDQFQIISAIPVGWHKSYYYFDTRQPISRETQNVHLGKTAVRLEDWGYSKEIALILDVKANVEYVLSYYIAASNTTSVNVGAIIRNTTNGSILINDRVAVAQAGVYEKRMVSFTPNADMTIQLEIGFNKVGNMNNTYVLIDSVIFESKDLLTLRDNIAAAVVAEGEGDSAAWLRYYFHLNPDGSFNDIDYTNQDPVRWQAANHIGSLLTMVSAWANPEGTLYLNAELGDGIVRAYNYWVSHDYTNPNWWFNEIYVPGTLSKVMLLLQKYEALPENNFDGAITIVHRAYPSQSTLTATNLVWLARATINEGVLRYLQSVEATEKAAAASLIQESFGRIGSTCAFTTSEGIQVDSSFQAHSVLLYNGGYGVEWVFETAKAAAFATDTSYGMSEDNIEKLADFLLDGQQWMVCGDNFDQSTIGRNRSRPGQSENALKLINAVQNVLTLCGTYRQIELEAMLYGLNYASINHQADVDHAPSGNRQFWRSDYMVHRRPNYFISVKTVSSRTRTPEYCDGEDTKSLFAHDGVMMIMRTGNEYDDIQPVWDWYCLPGTTTEHYINASYSLLPTGSYGTSPLAGGASDGTYGTTGFYYSNVEVEGKKSWFFFDNEVVALGSAIKAPWAHWNNLVETSINQTVQNGNVIYETTGGTLMFSSGTVTPANLKWVHHDSVGYFFPTPASNVTIRAMTQTGSWADINPAYSSDSISKDIFSMDINHGNRPTSGSYVYIVVPGLDAEDMDDYLLNNPISVICNDATIQAVRHDSLNITEATFYNAGTFSVGTDFTLTQVTSGKSSSVLVKVNGDQLSFSVASMDAFTGTLTYRITKQLEGTGAIWNEANGYTELTFDLPDGEYAGSTITRNYWIVSPDGLQSRLPGDANDDGKVDVGDLGILAANYGGSGKTWAQGDFNGDGLVDIGDLGILAANYGQGGRDAMDFNVDYTKALGITVPEDAVEDTGGPICSMSGLAIIAGFLWAGSMFSIIKNVI